MQSIGIKLIFVPDEIELILDCFFAISEYCYSPIRELYFIPSLRSLHYGDLYCCLQSLSIGKDYILHHKIERGDVANVRSRAHFLLLSFKTVFQ